MNINTAFPSKYIKASELGEDIVPVTIDTLTQDDVDGKGTIKPVLHFKGSKKALVLNVTNAKKIAAILGTAETDEWTDRRIGLYASETEFQGDTVPCIRVKPAPKAGKAAPKAAPAPVAVADDDDAPEDIVPF